MSWVLMILLTTLRKLIDWLMTLWLWANNKQNERRGNDSN